MGTGQEIVSLFWAKVMGGMSEEVEILSSSAFCSTSFFSAHWHCLNSGSPIWGARNVPYIPRTCWIFAVGQCIPEAVFETINDGDDRIKQTKIARSVLANSEAFLMSLVFMMF